MLAIKQCFHGHITAKFGTKIVTPEEQLFKHLLQDGYFDNLQHKCLAVFL
jgi:hypothetical protein